MRTKIKPLDGDDGKFVAETITAHEEWYGKNGLTDCIHAHFYGVYDESDSIVAFFAMCSWCNMKECVLACVYVKEECRSQGIFRKIVNFVKNKAYEYPYIVIGAKRDNLLANAIYSKMFKFANYDQEEDGNFYIIKEPKK